MRSSLLPLVALLTLVTASLSARDIYVDNRIGDDARDGTSPEPFGQRAGPCRSIARALKLTRKGDRLVLTNTGIPYRESITLQAARHSGTSRQPFILIGNGAVLDGTRVVPKGVWEHVDGDVFRFLPPRMSHQTLYLDGEPATRVPIESRLKLQHLQPRQWCLLDRHVHFRVEPERLPRQYDLRHTMLPVGITLYDVRHVIISDVTVQGFQLDGINAHDNVFETSLINVTSLGNGRSGISIGGASRVTVSDCRAADNGVAQVRTEGYSHTQIIGSDFDETSAPAIVRDGGRISLLPDDTRR
jgi:hypothetical protein